MTADPIGLTGGINLYAYVLNNPINAIDPFGLYEHKPCGPFHPPVKTRCNKSDSCKLLKAKEGLLMKAITSHKATKTYGTWTEWKEANNEFNPIPWVGDNGVVELTWNCSEKAFSKQ